MSRKQERRYAQAGGYFWLPCPLCGKDFGGHEWARTGHSSIATNRPGVGSGICPTCTLAGKGDPPWRIMHRPDPSTVIDWSAPTGERIGGVPPWQGGYLLERAT